MNKKMVYIVGQYRDKKGKSGHVKWEFFGVFDKEKDAVTACKDESYFVGPVEMNKTLSEESIIWPGLYYPIR